MQSVLEVNQIEEELRAFVEENLRFGRGQALRDDDSLIQAGVIDSTGIMELIEHLEETYGIQVEDGELVSDNLDSIAQIAVYVRRKTNGSIK